MWPGAFPYIHSEGGWAKKEFMWGAGLIGHKRPQEICNVFYEWMNALEWNFCQLTRDLPASKIHPKA